MQSKNQLIPIITPQQRTNILEIGDGRTIRIPINYLHFILDYSSNPKNKGWYKDEVVCILDCIVHQIVFIHSV